MSEWQSSRVPRSAAAGGASAAAASRAPRRAAAAPKRSYYEADSDGSDGSASDGGVSDGGGGGRAARRAPPTPVEPLDDDDGAGAAPMDVDGDGGGGGDDDDDGVSMSHAETARLLFETCTAMKRSMQSTLLTGRVPVSALGGAAPAAAEQRRIVVTRQPSLLARGRTLQPHQMQGLNWLLALWGSRASGILADDMGLGKTVQVVSMFAQLLEWHAADSPGEQPALGGSLGSAAAAASALLSAPAWQFSVAASATDLRAPLPTVHAAAAAAGAGTLEPASAPSSAAAVAAAPSAAVAVPPGLDIRAALRAAAKAGIALNITPAVASSLAVASSSAASSLASRVAGVNVGGAGAGSAADDSGSDSDDYGGDDSDAEYGDDGRRIKRKKTSADGGGAASGGGGSRAAGGGGFKLPAQVMPTFTRGSAGPHLVVAPTSVLTNWVRECKAFCPDLKVVLFAGSQADRKAARKGAGGLAGAHVVVTSYALLERADTLKVLKAVPWQALVLDEAHGLKNAGTARFRNIMELPARTRLLLTGTPVQNNVDELVSLLRFVVTDAFLGYKRGQYTNETNWEDEDADAVGAEPEAAEQAKLVAAMRAEVTRLSGSGAAGKRGGKKGRGAGGATSDASSSAASDASVSVALADVMSCFILRRTKGGIDLGLPPKTRVVDWVPMTPAQRAVADTLHGATLALAAPGSGLRRAVREALDAAGDARTPPAAIEAPVAPASATAAMAVDDEPALAASGKDASAVSAPPATPCAPPVSASSAVAGLPTVAAAQVAADPSAPTEPPAATEPAPVAAAAFSTALDAIMASGAPVAAAGAQPDGAAGGTSSDGCAASAPPSRRAPLAAPVVIGDLCRVFGDAGVATALLSEAGGGAGSATTLSTAAAAPAAVTGSVGRMVMLLRKVANHPLLLRTRYCDAAVLAAARLVWDASHDRDPAPLPAGIPLPAGGVSTGAEGSSKAAAVAAAAVASVPELSTGNGGGGLRSVTWESSPLQPTADSPAAAAGGVPSLSPSDALARVLAPESPPSSSASSQATVDDAPQALLRALAAAHTPLSRADLMAWARDNVGGDGGAGGGGAGAGAGASSGDKAVRALADLAESYLGSSDYQLHCVLSELAARDCPPAAALLLPDAAFLDAGKVRFLAALLEGLPLKPGGGVGGGGSGKGAASGASSGGGATRRHYASRVLVFSQFTQVLDILGACLRLLGHGYGAWARIDGSTPAGERQAIIDRWTADDTVPVMLLSTRAGGVGLNLTAADTVVLHDCDWNPLNDAQAEDRAHRMGQTRPVTVHRLLCPASLEVHMDGTAAGKLELVAALMDLSERPAAAAGAGAKKAAAGAAPGAAAASAGGGKGKTAASGGGAKSKGGKR